MSEYDELTKKILERLSKLDSPESELRKRYAEEMDRSRAEYEKSLQKLGANSTLQKNTVAAQSLIDKKNTAIKSESEGLSGAGVNAALEDSRGKKLENNIEEIEVEAEKAQAKLDEDLDNNLVALEKQQQSEYEKERASLEDELEELEKQKEEERRVQEEAEKKAQEEAERKAQEAENQEEKNNDTEAAEEKYKPTVTAKELAKSIIERFSSDAKSIQEYVDELKEKNNFDEEYLRDLNFALEAYGANESSDSFTGTVMSASKIRELVNESKSYYKDAYGKLYNTFSKLGESGLSLAKSTARMARMVQMDFFYRSSANKGQFETLCETAGIPTEEISEYYDRVEFLKQTKKGGIEMGEYLSQ